MHGIARYASRAWPLLALAVLLSGAALVRAAVSEPVAFTDGGAETGRHAFRSSASAPHQLRPLKLSGHVGGLYPGARKSFRVEVRNPNPVAVTVTSIRTRVDAAGAGCGGENVLIPGRRPQAVIPGRSSAEVRMKARMAGAAPDACQLGRFPLRFQARARAAR